jgi:hypothetical protein
MKMRFTGISSKLKTLGLNLSKIGDSEALMSLLETEWPNIQGYSYFESDDVLEIDVKIDVSYLSSSINSVKSKAVNRGWGKEVISEYDDKII